MSRRSVAALLLAVLICGSVAVCIAMNGGSEEDPEPEGPEVPEEPILPEGFSLTDGVISYIGPTEWRVFDTLHQYMTDGAVYRGITEDGESLLLDPGKYRITVAGETFEVTVPGMIQRDAEWKYVWNGSVHTVSVSFAIDAEDYIQTTEASRSWNKNARTGAEYSFGNLGGLVAVDGTIRDIASQLGSEYVRIGGSLSDRQGYADFMASFAQMTIEYPPSVQSKGEDFSVWGSDEYWCKPLETLYHMKGDCEDKSALLCSLYAAAGYQTAMGGHAGHVFAGVALDGFRERTDEELKGTVFNSGSLSYGYGILSGGKDDVEYGTVLYYSVETIKGQTPVGYLAGGTDQFGRNTFWGLSGLYPVE